MNEPRRLRRTKLNSAILGVLSSVAAASPALAEMEEIVVTATKKAVPLQNAPISVQAMTSRGIKEQRVTSFDDYIKLLPNVNAGGRGPGQNEIYIRGAAVDAINISVAEAQGSAPNVALYLDEQPVTAGGRNLDVYVTDIERIEVLPGPQGTLYGASSQAGTVRLITNKPRIGMFDASVSASSSFTKDGDMSTGLEAMVNIPVLDDRAAVRIALFSDNQGGYIDNVRGTFTPDPSLNPGLPSASGIVFTPAGGSPTAHEFADGTFAVPGQVYPVEYTTVNNDSLVEEDFNDASYQGFRVGFKYDINADWTLLLSHHQQTLEADGVFDYDPAVGDLEVERFAPDRLQDEFGQTSWTLEGRVGELELIYTGAYLKREVDQVVDYSAYANIGGYIPGYLCEYNTPGYHGGGGVGYTFDPTLSGDSGVVECTAADSFFTVDNENERWTHELRLSGDLNDMFGFTTGVFYDDFETRHTGNFNYGGQGWAPVDPSQVNPGTANDLNVRGPRTQFTNDITRPEEQIAVFGELAVRLTDHLTATLGARYYDLEVGFEGFAAFRYGNRPVPNLAGEPGVTLAPNVTGGRDYARNLGDFQPLSVDDVITKVTLSYDTDDFLVFATYSEGYRPPGFNRAAARGQATSAGVPARGNDGPGGFPDYFIPVIYETDEVTNMELGWKATLMDGLLRFNGSIYAINWDNIQVSHFDSQNISIFTIVDNGGDAEIRGIEGDLIFSATENLMLFAGFSYNDTELTSVNPTFDFVVADAGSELPLTPDLQLTARARYEWDIGKGHAHWQLGGKYASESFNSLVDIPVTDPRQKQDAYAILDATLGYRQDGWSVELFIDNLTDERAELHINKQDFRERITTNRPRSIGMKVSWDFQ
ncbi:MAG: TonB-dependent receptor [Pseudomonadales bacterium]|nr:TonB-dependent receptor [Pseudomonadales bacterium]